MAHKYLEISVITHAKSLSDEIVPIKLNLGKILKYYQDRQEECFALINAFCISHSFNGVGSASLFKNELSIIVHDATPDSPFFWFKRLYSFYQDPDNKNALLEKAIEYVLKPHIQQLYDSWTSIHKLYISLIISTDPVVKNLLDNEGKIFKKITTFTESMPKILLDLALKFGDPKMCSSESPSVAASSEESKSVIPVACGMSKR